MPYDPTMAPGLPGADRGTATGRIALQMPSAGQFAPGAIYDPQYGDMQSQALQGLSQEAASGGWTPDEMAAYKRMAAMSAGVAAGQRAGMAQRMGAKGLPASIANRIAGEMGQQQQSEMGYQMGTAAQQAANDRAYEAAQGLGAGAQQMGDLSNQEGMFNRGQRLRGVLKRFGTEVGADWDQQMRSDQQQQQIGQGFAQAGTGLLSMVGGAVDRSRSGGSGRKPSWGG